MIQCPMIGMLVIMKMIYYQDAREDLAREKASANELTGRLHTTEKDLNFKIKVR